MATVVIITEAFADLAAATLESRGMPELPVIVLPHDTEVLPMEELRPIVIRAVQQELLPLMAAARVLDEA
jgi:hypothetical protein